MKVKLIEIITVNMKEFIDNNEAGFLNRILYNRNKKVK